MMTLDRRNDLITVLKPYFLPKRLHSTKSFFYKSNRPHFLWVYQGFTGVITHLGCWENTRKACKSQAEGEWFTNFSSVLPTPCVGYHAGKPIESVVYCLNRISSFSYFPFPYINSSCTSQWSPWSPQPFRLQVNCIVGLFTLYSVNWPASWYRQGVHYKS